MPPYTYVLAANDLGYLLEVVQCQGQIQGISLPEGEERVSNQFVANSFFSISTEHDSVVEIKDCISILCEDSSAIINDNKTNYWLVGVEEVP